MKKRFLFIVCSLIGFLAACQSSTETFTTLPTPMPTVPPTSLPTVAPDCPAATTGTLLLKNEDDDYCLLYPEGYSVVIPYKGEVCLVPGEPEPLMACHNSDIFINVEAADGRTADQVADALIADADVSIEHSSLTIADEEAVMIDKFPGGMDMSRKAVIVHADRLYILTFIVHSGKDGNPDFDPMERLYTEVIGSFGFLSNE